MSKGREVKCNVTFHAPLWDRLQAVAEEREMTPERLVTEMVELQLAEMNRQRRAPFIRSARNASPAAAMMNDSRE